jgi:hypothetical protein
VLNAALGFRVHSGWAALVAVAEPRDAPRVIDRRRLELVDPRTHGAQQPYHAAKNMKLADKAAFLKQCTSATLATATASLQDIVSALADKGYAVAAACLLLGSGRPTGDLAATLRSHAMIHTAEGQFFRNALQSACQSCGVPLLGVKEKELISRAADDIRLSPPELHRRISEAGKIIGPPWRQDEKLCTIAGWLALAKSGA